MAFDFRTLVTDRTQQDVDYARQLIDKLVTGTATENERAEWNSFTLKGAYNYTDLNRVIAAMEDLKLRLERHGYVVPGYQRIKIDHPNQSKLPSGAIRLNWIQSTGTQYVDTGVSVPHAVARVVVEFAPMTVTEDSPVTGHKYYSWSWTTGMATMLANGKFFVSNNEQVLAVSVADSFYKLEYTTTYYKINDGDAVSVTAGAYTDGYNDTIFYANGKYGKNKLKTYKLYNGNTLVRDFIPCKLSDGSVGLWDDVEGKFYASATTTDFVAGTEAVRVPSNLRTYQVMAYNEYGEELDPYLWYEEDSPTVSQMEQYIGNVTALKGVLKLTRTAPKVPSDMENLTVDEANHIESILLTVDQMLTNMILTVDTSCATGTAYTGIYAKEAYL